LIGWFFIFLSFGMRISKVELMAESFLDIKNVTDLAHLLNIGTAELVFQSLNPKYKHFSIPKPNGKLRHIEDPIKPLKKIQGQLNDYLQAVYFLHKSEAAYGFMIGVKNHKNRNIISNATQHMNCRYLINVDIENFFHSITQQQVEKLFMKKPFRYKEALAISLASIVCYKGRLPMGAPTSPVVSNLFMRKLDGQLSKLSKEKNAVYTRYADDISFSSKESLEPLIIEEISAICAQSGLNLNVEKTKFYGEKDSKIVTGLYITDRLSLPRLWKSELNDQIEKLHVAHELQVQYKIGKSKWMKKHKQRIKGYLNFAKDVLGDNDVDVMEMERALRTAIKSKYAQGPTSWRSLPSQFF